MKTPGHAIYKKSEATGSMTATVQSGSARRDFATTQLYFSSTDSYIGALGYNGISTDPDEYIFVGLPIDFVGEAHPVLPEVQKGAFVYIHCLRTGYANAGMLTDVRWDQDNQVFSGKFYCEGKDQQVGEFNVVDGTFSLNY